MVFLIIDKRLALKGPVDFESKVFFGLEPGTKVCQIGDGRENGSFRTDVFRHPHEYVGSIFHQMEGEITEYFAFRIPTQIYAVTTSYYFLYESTGAEILGRTKTYNRFFKAEFKIA